MECAKIRELLSEYIDDILGGETKALVEKHLLTCKDCKEELASLKALVSELGSFESVEAPRDFIERLHERMEPRFALGKLMRTLFVPVRIKVPLEFATLAAMAILVFYVSNTQQRGKQIVRAPEVSIRARSAKKDTVDAVETVPRKELYKLKPDSKQRVAQQPKRDRGTIELALVLETDVPTGGYAPSSATEAESVPEKRARVSEQEPRVTSPPETRAAAQVAREVEMEGDVLKEEKPGPGLRMGERLASEDEAESAVSYLDETLSKVEELIGIAGGKAIFIEYDAETDRPQSISAEIPAKNYDLLLVKLKQLATLQAAPSTISGTDQEAVQIRIRFISPK